MASKFNEINAKFDEKAQEVIEKVTGKGDEQEDSSQEYYQPRTPDQIVDGGKLVLSKDQVDEAEGEKKEQD